MFGEWQSGWMLGLQRRKLFRLLWPVRYGSESWSKHVSRHWGPHQTGKAMQIRNRKKRTRHKPRLTWQWASAASLHIILTATLMFWTFFSVGASWCPSLFPLWGSLCCLTRWDWKHQAGFLYRASSGREWIRQSYSTKHWTTIRCCIQRSQEPKRIVPLVQL